MRRSKVSTIIVLSSVGTQPALEEMLGKVLGKMLS